MKAARIVQLIALGILVFGLGAGLSYWQRTNSVPVETAAEETAEPQEQLAMTRMAPQREAEEGIPAIESGTIVADAPPMPGAEGQEKAAVPTPGEVFSQASAVQDGPATPVAGMQVGGPFALTDHNGNEVTEASWPGKYKLIFFGFTSCPEICPAALQKISAVMDAVDPQAEKIQPLFITTDPARDTQDVMKIYSEGYTAVLGLTGTKEQLDAAYKAYKVYAAGEDHSALVYLMSPEGVFLSVFDSHTSAEDMLAKVTETIGATAE